MDIVKTVFPWLVSVQCLLIYLFRHSWSHKILQLLDQVSCMSFPLNEPTSDLLLLAINWSWGVLVTICKHAIGHNKFGQRKNEIIFSNNLTLSFYIFISGILCNHKEQHREHQAPMTTIEKWYVRSFQKLWPLELVFICEINYHLGICYSIISSETDYSTLFVTHKSYYSVLLGSDCVNW